MADWLALADASKDALTLSQFWIDKMRLVSSADRGKRIVTVSAIRVAVLSQVRALSGDKARLLRELDELCAEGALRLLTLPMGTHDQAVCHAAEYREHLAALEVAARRSGKELEAEVLWRFRGWTDSHPTAIRLDDCEMDFMTGPHIAAAGAAEASAPAVEVRVVDATSGAGGTATPAPAAADLPPTRDPDAWHVFVDSVYHVFGRWPTLQDAVRESWGGPSSQDKYDRLVEDVVENCRELWVRRKDLPWESIDVFVDEVMLSDFNADLEDNSTADLGKDLQRRFRMCADGEAAAAEDLMRKEQEQQAAAAKPKPRKAPKKVTDDDGWTTVGAAGGAAAAAGAGDGDSDGGSGSDDGDDSGSEGESEGEAPPAKAAASTTVDGWTTVAKSGSKGRRRR
ncbi:hypothetical protein FNF29_02834 [Cafeteria roenbergensis]|uniref:Uncharacterized protein n=1 Tax=Cafeteria roenbergensis TaxID=33653 RepID=A0A5A8CLE0_CAFRO|nr:hypothetical protein FNF29_02834 [Cafeteria roenbergensis]|eukprot:KAA0153845.1 hypothetical protein FNF29_02834 [Cafeteria roenbergensis]